MKGGGWWLGAFFWRTENANTDYVGNMLWQEYRLQELLLYSKYLLEYSSLAPPALPVDAILITISPFRIYLFIVRVQ